MAELGWRTFLRAGVDVGHRVRRSNPKMRSYVFTERDGVHIIDLRQTIPALEKTLSVVRDTVAEGGTVLFVGTKRGARDVIAQEALRCGEFYINRRWLDGTLTDWRTTRAQFENLSEMEAHQNREGKLPITLGALRRRLQIGKLNGGLGGINQLQRLPDLLYVVDVRREAAAVKEANSVGIPVIAIVSTGCDPDPIDYVIPGNDDAIPAIRLITGLIADAVLEGNALCKVHEPESATMDAAAEEDVDYRGVAMPTPLPELSSEEEEDAGVTEVVGEWPQVEEPVMDEPPLAEVVAEEPTVEGPVAEDQPAVALAPEEPQVEQEVDQRSPMELAPEEPQVEEAVVEDQPLVALAPEEPQVEQVVDQRSPMELAPEEPPLEEPAVEDWPLDTALDGAVTDEPTGDGPSAQDMEAETGLPSLAEIQDRMQAVSARRIWTLIADLHSARSELARAEAEHNEAVTDAAQAVARIRGHMDEIRQTAARMRSEAIALLGDDAQDMIDQIRAAEEAELAVEQAELSRAEARARTAGAAHQLREAALAQARARVQSLATELETLVESSPAAARIARQARELEASMAEPQAEKTVVDARRVRGDGGLITEQEALRRQRQIEELYRRLASGRETQELVDMAYAVNGGKDGTSVR